MGLSQDQFVASIAEVLEVPGESLQPETVLADLEYYDSVKTLSLLVALDEMGIMVTQNDVAGFSTFGDVLEVGRARGVLARPA